jgi:hypothetical protein
LEKLWQDPDGMREMLDLRELFNCVIESPAAIRITPRFYFYMLVRHAFLQSGLSDVELADYVAGVLAKRVCTELADPLQDVTCGFTHAAEFISFISSSTGRMRFHLQVAAGNQFLVLTGMYPDFLKRRSAMGHGPGLEFYEAFAQRSFLEAADSGTAAGVASRHLFGSLAEAMPTARRTLNRVAEEFVFLGD